MAVAAIGGVEQLAHAFRAGGDVRRQRGRAGRCRARAAPDLEALGPGDGQQLDLDRRDARERRRLRGDRQGEALERRGRSLDLGDDDPAVVSHVACELVAVRQGVNERPEPNPLNHPRHSHPTALRERRGRH